MNFNDPNPLDDLIHFPFRTLFGKVDKLMNKQPLITLKHTFEIIVHQGFIPVRTRKDPANLWRIEDLAHTPHERSEYPHQLVLRHPISLIQNTPNFIIIVRSDGLNHFLKLIANIQFVGIKQ
jgi:hypothetical protein